MLRLSIRNLATSVSCQEFICLYSAACLLTPTFLHLPLISNHTSNLERQRECSYRGAVEAEQCSLTAQVLQMVPVLRVIVSVCV